MPSNKAAWITGSKVKPLEVRDAPYTPPREKEIVIKNGAVAINPADWLKQDVGNIIYSWIKYPFVMGTDVAGEVVEVGSGVTRFKVGDRVVGFAVAIDQKVNDSAYGAFQEYTVLLAHMTSQIPSTMSYEDASVIPLGISTAACGLFQKDQLGLQYPSVPRPKATGTTLLVWGGSTSVGCNAIQLAVAAGYEVITTASPKNFDLVKRLGASQAFDYNSKTVVDDVIRAFKGKTIAGAMSIGQGAADACMDVLYKCQGDKKFLSMISYPTPSPPPKTFVMLKTIYTFMSWSLVNFFKSRARNISNNFVFGSTLVYNEVGSIIYEDFLPKALADGSFIAAPEATVIGKGLEHIQAGFDLQKNGMSAKKVVITL